MIVSKDTHNLIQSLNEKERQIFLKIVDRFVERKMRGSCFCASALLYETFKHHNIPAIFKKGYLLYREHNSCCLHFWVELNGLKIDIGSSITEQTILNVVGMRINKGECVDYIADDVERGDLKFNRTDTIKLLEGYDKYSRNPKKVWKNAPSWMFEFRKELLS